jgi:hypothetical protein
MCWRHSSYGQENLLAAEVQSDYVDGHLAATSDAVRSRYIRAEP